MTPEVISAVMPRCKEPADWARAFTIAFNKFGVGNASEVAAFLAQVAHESSELTRLEENLNYSGTRLMAVWPKRFPTLGDAAPYAKNPRALANRVYANRLGNGDEASGDGWLYRGRGPLQLTGKTNYQAFFKAVGPTANLLLPAVLLDPEYGALSAVWFWRENKLAALALDTATDDDEEDFRAISRRINGGDHGMVERRRYWMVARTALGA